MARDTIGELLTRIRNANFIKSPIVVISKTRINFRITQILKREGFIKGFKILSSRHIILYLKYSGSKQKPVINHLYRISKPGRRVYTNSRDIPDILSGLGVVFISSSRGIITDQDARIYKIGGEVLCSVW